MEFYFLKNISFRGLTFIGRFADAVEQLESRGIKLPACFSVSEKQEKDEGTVWLALYDENYHFPEVKVSKRKLSKPRKNIPSEVLP